MRLRSAETKVSFKRPDYKNELLIFLYSHNRVKTLSNLVVHTIYNHLTHMSRRFLLTLIRHLISKFLSFQGHIIKFVDHVQLSLLDTI